MKKFLLVPIVLLGSIHATDLVQDTEASQAEIIARHLKEAQANKAHVEAMAPVEELMAEVQKYLKGFNTPAPSHELYAKALHRTLVELHKKPRKLVNNAMRAKLKSIIQGLDYRLMSQELQKQFNSLLRRFGGALKTLQIAESMHDRIERYKSDLIDHLQLIDQFDPESADFTRNLNTILPLLRTIFNKAGQVISPINPKVYLDMVEQVNYAVIPLKVQEGLNQFLVKGKRSPKALVKDESLRKQAIKEQQERIEGEGKKDRDEGEYLIPLFDKVGTKIGKPINIAELTDVIEDDSLENLIKERADENKGFILARVLSSHADGQEYVHFYEAHNMNNWRKHRAVDPSTQYPIQNIQYFKFDADRKQFVFVDELIRPEGTSEGDKIQQKAELDALLAATE